MTNTDSTEISNDDALFFMRMIIYAFIIVILGVVFSTEFIYDDISVDFKKKGFKLTFYILCAFLIIILVSIATLYLNEDNYYIMNIFKDEVITIRGLISHGIITSLIIVVILSIVLIVISQNKSLDISEKNYFILIFGFIILSYMAYIFFRDKIHNHIIGWIVSCLAIVDLILSFASTKPSTGNRTLNIFSYISNLFRDIYENIQYAFDVIKAKINENENVKNEFYMQMKKTGIFFAFFSFSIIALFFANNDDRSNSNLMYFYTFIIIIPILIGLYMSSMLAMENELSIYEKIIISISFVLIFGTAYCYSYNINPFTSIYMYSFGNVILSLMAIIFLGIIFIIFSDYLKKQRGIIGFIVNFIFFIPCLLIDFIEYMKEQMSITPNIVYVMFILELLVIIAYIYLPSMIHLLLHKDSVKLKKNPYYLKNKNVVATNDVFKVNNNNELNVDPYLNSNYSFSFWFYLNTDSYFAVSDMSDLGRNSLNEKNIFDFANGRPKLVYINDEIHNDVYRFYLSNKCADSSTPCTPSQYKTNYVEFNGLPKQRWNFIVINYGVNTADVFVNGNLKGSIEFNGDNIPNSINETNVVTIGDDVGLDGAIKEMYYYKKALSKFEIVNMYNLFNAFGTY